MRYDWHENNNWIINKYDCLFSKPITHSKAVAYKLMFKGITKKNGLERGPNTSMQSFLVFKTQMIDRKIYTVPFYFLNAP